MTARQHELLSALVAAGLREKTKTSRALSIIERFGVFGAAAMVCFVLAVLSASIAATVHWLMNDPINRVGLTNTLLIPFVLGVPSLLFLFGLLRELHETRRELTRILTWDMLTGALNRRSLMAVAEAACAQGGTLSLALIDADRFKQVNDVHGHLVGDTTLRQLTSSLHDDLPRNGICGRFGGEEFVVLLPGVAHEEALELADRLRDGVATRCDIVDDHELNITVSIGVATMDSQPDLDTLLAQADLALYAAKRGGRNRVVSAQAL